MKKTLLRSGVLLVLLIVSFTSFSQKRKSAILRYDTAARQGAVLLTNGNELTGRLVYNDNDGIFTLYSGEAYQSFNARAILEARFFDPAAGRDRLFYSLEYNDPESGLKDTEFFEVLKELDSFVVLVRMGRLQTAARKPLLAPRPSAMLVDRRDRQSRQTQTVIFLSDQGGFEPYMEIVEKELGNDLLDYHEKNTRMVNASLFKKHTGVHFGRLVDFAKQHSLSFKRKADIVTILEEYERLSRR